jgi:hypothetical protein
MATSSGHLHNPKQAKSAFAIGANNEAAKGVMVMSKKQLNWKEVGRVFAVFLNLFAVIRHTFMTQGVGLEIIGWITGEGKNKFVEEFLKPLGEQFLAAQRIIVVDENTIRVNLDAPPNLPFDGATVETNKGGGGVTVQKREDCLYVDDSKVILHRSERQKDGKVQGYELRDEVTNLPVLHPNIMDALYEHSHLIPEDWKKDENGNTIFIYFWAVTYRFSVGSVCVRCLYWYDGAWHRSYRWLYCDWSVSDPAAVLASN